MIHITFENALYVSNKQDSNRRPRKHYFEPEVVITTPHKFSADVRFPDLETEGKNAKRMSGSVTGLKSINKSDESNDNLKS